MRLRKIDDSGVLKSLLRSVPNAVQENIAGKQRIIDKNTKIILDSIPEPNTLPKVPNNTKSCIQAFPFTNCNINPVRGPNI